MVALRFTVDICTSLIRVYIQITLQNFMCVRRILQTYTPNSPVCTIIVIYLVLHVLSTQNILSYFSFRQFLLKQIKIKNEFYNLHLFHFQHSPFLCVDLSFWRISYCFACRNFLYHFSYCCDSVFTQFIKEADKKWPLFCLSQKSLYFFLF